MFRWKGTEGGEDGGVFIGRERGTEYTRQQLGSLRFTSDLPIAGLSDFLLVINRNNSKLLHRQADVILSSLDLTPSNRLTSNLPNESPSDSSFIPIICWIVGNRTAAWNYRIVAMPARQRECLEVRMCSQVVARESSIKRQQTDHFYHRGLISIKKGHEIIPMFFDSFPYKNKFAVHISTSRRRRANGLTSKRLRAKAEFIETSKCIEKGRLFSVGIQGA